MIFLVELNSTESIAADIDDVYLEACTNEKICFIVGREFKDYGHDGNMMLIVKVLCGLKTLGARFHVYFAETMNELGFIPSKVDLDIWTKDCKDL